jgi:hypothetical protein
VADWAECPNCGVEVRGRWLNLDGDWNGAEDQQPYKVPRYSDPHFGTCPGSFETGGAVALGLVLMALAIGGRSRAGMTGVSSRGR